MKKIILFLIIVLSLVIFVNGHSDYLFDINLDFDPELKQSIIKAAQDFLKTNKQPITFDLDNGLIMVHFEPSQKNYVEINPLDYEVYGFRNENLKHKSGAKTISEQQGLEIAKKEFGKLDEKARSELKYYASNEFDNTYFYKWFREVNGIIVIGEDFFVNVDAVNGSVISRRLAIFGYPQNLMQKNPAISLNVAKKISELSFNTPSVEKFQLYLVIYRDELIWVNKLQGQFYPFFVGVSAKDGSIAFTGVLPGEVPDSYTGGKDLEVVENDIIKAIL